MLNPYYGLFQYSRNDMYTLQINAESGVNPVSAITEKWNCTLNPMTADDVMENDAALWMTSMDVILPAENFSPN